MIDISVVMGVYQIRDRKKFVQSVKSVLDQSLENLELIICDDGSGDDTLDFVKKVAVQDHRIIVLEQPQNRGLASALNLCIELARGKYIARQDDDDVSKLNRLEKEYVFLETHPKIGFVGSNAELIYNNRVWGTLSTTPNPDLRDFLWTNPYIHPTVMFRKDALLSVNGYRVAPETKRSEDYDLFMRLFASGIVGHNIQEKLYTYEMSQSNARYRSFSERWEEAVVRYKGFRLLHAGIKGIPFVFKPIIIGLLPQSLLNVFHRRMFN